MVFCDFFGVTEVFSVGYDGFWSRGWSFGATGVFFGGCGGFFAGDGGGRAGSGKGLAIRHSGDVLMGGASGAGSLLLNTKASQEAACSRAPAAIVPDQGPESHDEGVSRFVGNGSHLAEVDTAEGHAGQVDGPGSSGNARIGSHLEAADFSNEPGAVLWRHTPPRRTESGLLSYGTASPDSSVQKTALWRTRAHLSAGAARGGGSSAGRHVERMTGVSGNRWRIVVAQVRRKSMMARLRQSR